MMDQRLSIVTLGVADVARARAFYEAGLGWRVSGSSTAAGRPAAGRAHRNATTPIPRSGIRKSAAYLLHCQKRVQNFPQRSRHDREPFAIMVPGQRIRPIKQTTS